MCRNNALREILGENEHRDSQKILVGKDGRKLKKNVQNRTHADTDSLIRWCETHSECLLRVGAYFLTVSLLERYFYNYFSSQN